MKRSSFLKSLATLLVAPSVISKIDFDKGKNLYDGEIVNVRISELSQYANTRNLFNDMNYIVPDYIPKLYERYGSDNYTMFINEMSK